MSLPMVDLGGCPEEIGPIIRKLLIERGFVFFYGLEDEHENMLTQAMASGKKFFDGPQDRKDDMTVSQFHSPSDALSLLLLLVVPEVNYSIGVAPREYGYVDARGTEVSHCDTVDTCLQHG